METISVDGKRHYVRRMHQRAAEQPQQKPGYKDFLIANEFLKRLKAERKYLTPQQVSTLKGVALKGDIDGAWKGLEKLLKEAKK